MHRFLTVASFAIAVAVLAPRGAFAQGADASPAPSPTPAPAATKEAVGVKPEAFVVGDYLTKPQVYNLASSGGSGDGSYDFRTAYEFKVEDMPFMLAFNTDNYNYTHSADGSGKCPTAFGCITQIGHTGEKYVPASVQRDTDYEGQIGYRIAYPRIYAVVAYLGRQSSFNFPIVNGVGLGFTKLPNYEAPFSVYFSGLYFPDLEGRFNIYNRTTGNSIEYTLTEHVIRYQAGVTLAPMRNSPAFIDLGVIGDGIHAGNADPGSETHMAEYIGLGIFEH